MKQVILVFICATIAAICFGTSDVPKECQVGTQDFNETWCTETCTKPEIAEQPFCANLTHPVTPKPTVLLVPTTEEKKVDKEEPKPSEHSHDESKGEHTKSLAFAVRPSIMFGASYLLLYFCL